jgi:hypothetical protein
MYEDLLERLILHYTSPIYDDEVAAAKSEFFDEAGVVDEENIHFEMRMTQFLEWYLLTRKLRDRRETPAQLCLSDRNFKMNEHERQSFLNIANAHHSLFEFLKLRGDDVHVQDLFSGEKTVIQNSPVKIGFSREEFFSARLIPVQDGFTFGKAFCFHPEDARKYVLSEVDKVKNADHELHDALILRLTKMRYKYEQYRHLKLTDVYTNERRVRF